jgi:hypothetical protein
MLTTFSYSGLKNQLDLQIAKASGLSTLIFEPFEYLIGDLAPMVQLPRCGSDEGGRDAPLVELTGERLWQSRRVMK